MCECERCLYLDINVGRAFTVAQLYILDAHDAIVAVLFFHICICLRMQVTFTQSTRVNSVYMSCSFNLCFDTHLVWPLNIFSMQLFYLSVSFVCVDIFNATSAGCSFLRPLCACMDTLVFRFDRRVYACSLFYLRGHRRLNSSST